MMRATIFALLFCLTLGASFIAVSADADDNIDAFKKGWRSDVLLEKKRAVEKLDTDSHDYVEYHYEVMNSPHWLIRWESMNTLLTANSDFLKKMIEQAREEDDLTFRSHLMFVLSIANNADQECWDYLREVLIDEEEEYSIMTRIEVARHFNRNYQGADPERNKRNFDALLTTLAKVAGTDEDSREDAERDLKKDRRLRQLKWLLVYGMEKLTSQRFGDRADFWQVWWKDNKEKPMLYRDDGQRISTEAEGVKVEGQRYAREDYKLPTDLELLVLPSVEFWGEWMQPYIYELTKHFKVTMLRMPDTSTMPDLKRPKDRATGREDPNAYYVPIDRVYKVFEARRKEEGGNVGMIALGANASFMAMEYAKNQPDGIQFIVCIGAYPDNSSFSDALGSARDQGDDKVLQSYAAVMRTYYGPDGRINRQTGRPDPFTDEEIFRAQIGDISHLLADKNDPNHIWYYIVRNQAQRQRQQEMEDAGVQPSRQASLVDPEYAFEGNRIEVPALFFHNPENDPLMDKKSPKAIGRMFKHSHMVELENTGATPFAEDPMGFYEAFMEFMEDEDVWEKIRVDREEKD